MITLALTIVALFIFSAIPAGASTGPNVLLVIVDDLGTSDSTPQIDTIADTGVRLAQMHANSYCSPTRASIMTGSYAERARITKPLTCSDTNGLPPSEHTIAESFHDAGYKTALIGKWHLGRLPQFRPTEQGFDRFYGMLTGMIDHSTHLESCGNIDWWDQNERNTTIEYDTTAITRESKRFMAETPQPWFLVASYHAVHRPNQAPDGTESYAGQLAALDKGVADLIHSAPANTVVWYTSDNGGFSGHNASLRGGKGTVYQGGIRVSSFVRWGNNLPPAKLNRLAHVIDILPTLSDLAGVPVGRTVDGLSIAQELRGEPWGPARDLYFSTGNNFAERLGSRWKLVLTGGTPALFDLIKDPNEIHNIAASYPARVSSMRANINRWRTQVGK